LKLKGEGYKIGIASNGNKEIIISKLKSYGVDSVVDSIIGYEQVSMPKPSPEGLLKCLGELKVKPGNALYIGDMESDIRAAKAAGVKIIAVTYGYLKLKKDIDEQLKNADIIVNNVDEIYERIKNG
jgi:phosphoglycolate phosphatase